MSKGHLLSAILGTVGGMIVGAGAVSLDKSNVENDIATFGTATEVVVTNSNGSQFTDTLISIPLNATKDFHAVAYPLIQTGKLKVTKLNDSPKP